MRRPALPALELAPELTTRPVIGVLALEASPAIRKVCGDHDSYIAASYVKFVEVSNGAGRCSIPPSGLCGRTV